MPFDLNSIVSARSTYRPQRFILYGVQGIGKTSCAATFAAPIVLRTEDGACALDIPTFPEIAATYTDVENAIKALHGEHPFRTLVLDSIDWLEPLVWARVCQDHQNIKSIEDISYGKGYVEADNWWRRLQGGFDSLRFNKGMQIVIIAHAEVKTYSPPDDEKYDRYQPKLHKRAFALWQEWADEVFFFNYRKTVTARDDKGQTFRAVGSGDRIIYTQERPAFLAKNRWSLPDEITIGHDRTWKPLHDALRAAIGEPYPYPFAQEAKHD